MLRTMIIIVAFLTTCCGTPDPVIDHELQPIVDEYLMYAPNKGDWDALDEVRFGELEGTHEDGECYEVPYYEVAGKPIMRAKIITIRRTIPRNARFKATVIHELLHCLHGMEHEGDKYNIKSGHMTMDEKYWESNTIPQLIKAFE